jgi:hypothetical protein
LNLSRILRVGLLVLSISLPTWAQESEGPPNFSTRWLLDFKLGVAGQLGYKFPSTSLGLSVERPIRKRLEIQGSVAYSPDRKVITNDGNSLSGSASGIAWLTSHVGISGGIEGSQLWTSKFGKGTWSPILGTVIHVPVLDPGRLTVLYAFPTGCVWATPDNPCKIQSNRLQGVQLKQEIRTWPHLRLGLEVGIYHFCDQSNQNEQSVPRTCHIAGASAGIVRFEFPAGSNNDLY